MTPGGEGESQQDKHPLYHTFPGSITSKEKETNTGIYIFFASKTRPRQTKLFFSFHSALVFFYSNLAMKIAPEKPLPAQGELTAATEVAIILLKLFGSLVLVSLKISPVQDVPV